ncbi:hypothetical protein F3Y22_tig00110893pilonHSYRG00622 [Hibiscus syriacus]|uniref:Uncharacterized protein n=1 Tax=Hibiscus syriacus TaxID=106335 RepID=A0A6A2ZIS3_HIBSY|nr:hypothetical protein F3Y22_tig00110893pilonHSYRG00622 [Hibiscus syriacus]
MASCCRRISLIVPIFVFFLLVSSPIHAKPNFPAGKRAAEAENKYRWDVIDCVAPTPTGFRSSSVERNMATGSTRETKCSTPRDDDDGSRGFSAVEKLRRNMSGRTIPIRRTTERDVLRANSVACFGKKPAKLVRRDTTSDGHEVGVTERVFGRYRFRIRSQTASREEVGYVSGDEYYGAKASINGGHQMSLINTNSAYHNCGSSPVHSATISTPRSWLAGMSARSYTGTIIQDSSLIGPLQLELQSHQHHPTVVDNLTSAYWFGRIQSTETGGSNSDRGFSSDTGHRSCSPPKGPCEHVQFGGEVVNQARRLTHIDRDGQRPFRR